MNQRSAILDTLKLTRPAQWPILTAQLAVGLVLAFPLLSPDWSARLTDLSLWRVGSTWFVWVVLLNGGTLAFNSAYDRDTGPVAYLAAPPPPPPHLARIALFAMALGTIIAALTVSPYLGALLTGCTILSVLYSHPRSRWKSRPGWDLATNSLGYGAGTTLAGMLAVTDSITDSGWLFAAGFGLLFGSFYPLTQIYQTESDRARGDRTLTTALGIRPALLLAVSFGAAAAAILWWNCRHLAWSDAVSGVLVAWCAHIIWWWAHADTWNDHRHERGMYHALGLWALTDGIIVTAWLRG